MSKSAVLLLIGVLALSSLVMVGTVFAQSIPKPSVPEFTVELEAHPYYLPPAYSIDPYTGENVTIHEGVNVANRSIVITIGNQHVSSSYILFYNVRFKGHFEDRWTDLYSYSANSYSSGDLPTQSNSDYTVLSIPPDFPPNSKLDYQVEALLWHYVDVWIPDHIGMSGAGLEKAGHYEPRLALASTSGWSTTQTVTFPPILPYVRLLLPQNANFNTSTIQFDFAVDKPVSQIEYSLDCRVNVTVIGNTTLTGLTNGSHNVTVYATDEAGNTGTSETILFNVEVSEAFPVLPLALALVVIRIAAGAGLLLYFRKHIRGGTNHE
jgi:hypothetical protein